MKLLRIGPVGDENSAALVGESNWIDPSDVVDDFGEAFFGSGGLDRIAPIVAQPSHEPVRVRTSGDHRIGAPIARAGVGMGFRPPIWVQPGHVKELGIEGLGRQRQNVLAPR